MLSGKISTDSIAQSKEVKYVETAIETLRKAMADADSIVLDNLTSPDLTYGHSNGKVQSKAEFIHTIITGESDFVTIALSNPAIKIYGETAVARHEFIADTNDGGKPGKVKLHILWIWHLENHSWKLLARQAVRI